MNGRTIYLVFTRTGTWLSRLINLFIKVKYTHSSISLDDSFTHMYSFGRRNPNNPFSGGFVEENLYDGVFRKFSRSECLIYRLEISEEEYITLRSEIDKFIMTKDKFKYNFLGLFGVLLNKPVIRKNHYFCTQFVSELLIKSSIYKTDKSSALIKPDDLISIKNKEIVYEGFINEHLNFIESYNFS